MSGTIVTELIVDARPAQKGTADYDAAMRVAENAASRAIAAQEKLATSMRAAGTAAAEGGEKIEGQTRATSRAEASLAAYLGRLDPIIFAQQRLGKELGTVETGMSTLDKQWQRMGVSSDEYLKRTTLLGTRQKELKDTLTGLTAGTISHTEALGKLGVATASTGDIHKNASAEVNNMAFATRQLGVQTVQALSGIATGQGVLTVLIQQGHQVGDVMLSSGTGMAVFGNAAKLAFGALVTPIGIAVTATAAIVAFAYAAETSATRLGTLRNELSLVRADYQGAAEQAEIAARKLAATSALSTSQARTLTNAVYKEPVFSGTADQAAEIARVFEKLNLGMGKAIDDTATLKAVLTDAAGAAAKLFADNPGASGLSQALVKQARDLEDQGKKADAVRLVLDALGKATANVTEQTTPFKKAIHDLQEEFYGAQKSGKGFADVIGGPILAEAAHFLRDIQEMVRSIKAVGDAWDTFQTRRAQSAATAGTQTQYIGGEIEIKPDGIRPPGSAPIAPPSSGLRSASDLAPDRSAVRDIIRDFFTTGEGRVLGLGTAGVAGILANVQHESGFNPRLWNAENTDYGAFQYSKTGGRYQKLTDFTGQTDPGIDAQLKYFLHEAQTTAFGRVLQQMAAVPDTRDGAIAASRIFTSQWEIPKNAGWQSLVRSPAAGQHYDALTMNPAGVQNPAIGAGPGAMGLTVRGTPIADPGLYGPPAPAGTGGIADTNKSIIDGADKAREALGLNSEAVAKLKREIVQYTDAAKVAFDKGDTKKVDEYNEAIKKLKDNLAAAETPQDQFIRQQRLAADAQQPVTQGARDYLTMRQRIDEFNRQHSETAKPDDAARIETQYLREKLGVLGQVEGLIGIAVAQQNKLAAAYGEGSVKVLEVAAGTQAYNEAIKLFRPGSAEAEKATRQLTTAFLAQAAAAQSVAAGSKLADGKQQAVYAQAELATLGQSAEVRARSLADVKARQEIEKSFPLLADEEKQKLINQAVALADINTALQQKQQALAEISNFAGQIADQIGNGISNAFLSGQKAAITFGNVAKSILTLVAKEALQLAILNPILNSLTGSSKTTLGGVLGLLGSGGAAVAGAAGGGGGGGLFEQLKGYGSNVSSIGSAVTLSDKLGFTNIGGQFSSLGESLGLTGNGGVLTNISSGVNALLDYSLISPSFIGAGTTASQGAALASLGEIGAIEAAGVGGATGAGIGGTTVGAAIGGISTVAAGLGLGFAGGSLIAQYTPNPENGQIGAGVGAVGGAITGGIIGSAFTPIGTVIGAGIGGLIGGLSGGAAGGFIGPGPPSSYAGTNLNFGPNGIQLGSSANQVRGSNRESVQSDTEAFNKFLADNGVTLISADSIRQFGVSKGSGSDPTIAKNLEEALPRFRFSANDNELLKKNIENRSFGSSAELGQLAIDVRGFQKETLPAIRAFSDALGNVNQQGSLGPALKNITDQFAPAIAMAKKLGEAEVELTDIRDLTLAKTRENANKVTNTAVAVFNERKDVATATASGDYKEIFRTQLANFDAAGRQQVDAFNQQAMEIFGTGIKTNEDHLRRVAKLEEAIGAERVLVVKQYTDKLLQAERQLNNTDQGFALRSRNAYAGIANDPAFTRDTQVLAFDVQAQQQRESFSLSLIATYGDAYAATHAYADQIALLETALGAERLAIVKQQNDRITAAFKSTFRADEALTVRAANANIAATGGPQDQISAQLHAFNTGARQQTEDFSAQLTQTFGDAFTATQAYADQMALLETTLGAERLSILRQYNLKMEQAARSLFRTDEALNVRATNARATISGSADDQQFAKLYAFDISAQQQRVDTIAQLTATFGGIYTTTQAYADQMALLETTLGLERLAIAKQANTQITQAATTSIASLEDYVRKLELSPASPLSPQDQLARASAQFNGVQGAALAGDINSVNKLPGYSDSLIAASRAVNGSGAAYVADFQRVLDAFAKVGEIAPDTLTASILQVETRTQTQILVDELQKLRAEVAAVKEQLRQGSAAPARIAA